jgi:Mg-chelatase subunit ChlI
MAGVNEDVVAQIAATLMAGAGRAEHSEADVHRAVKDAYRIVDVVTEQGKQRRAKQAAAQDAAHAPETGNPKTNFEPLR